MKILRWLAPAVVVLTAGCAVLTVDIDVYKGPLAFDEAVQVRQFASVALAAKPLLVDLRNQYLPQAIQSRSYIKDPKTIDDPRARYLNSAVGAYADLTDEQQDPNTAQGFQFGRERCGIESLVQMLADVYSETNGDKVYSCGSTPNARDRDKLRSRVENALVAFASKLVYIADNLHLLSLGAGSSEGDRAETGEQRELRVRMSTVLQTIGNSLLVQADDFSRRRVHVRAQHERAAVEQRAVEIASGVNAEQLFNRLDLQLAGERSGIVATLERLPVQSSGATSAHATAEAKIKPLTDAVAAAAGEANRAALEKRRDAFKTAREALEKVRAAALKRATDAGGVSDPSLMLGIVRDELEKARALAQKAKEGGTDGDPAPYEAALAVLVDITPPRNAALRPPGDDKLKARTAKDVLDDVITALRQQELQALASGEATRAQNLRNAIERALKQRADMAFLRPPQAYLRSIYTASALQSGRADPDSNLLFKQNLSATFGFPTGDEKHYRDERKELDRQAWQNINTVKVAGGGATNFVIAKDDVGNWYVKGYESDPEAIYRAARSAALFNLGRQFDVDLLRRADLERTLDQNNLSDDRRKEARDELSQLRTDRQGARGTGALGGAVTRYKADYVSGARNDVETLLVAVEGIGTALNGQWAKIEFDPDRNKDNLLSTLAGFATGDDPRLTQARQALNEANVQPADGERLTNGIVTALRHLRLYQADAGGRIEREPKLVKDKEDALNTAVKEPQTSEKIDAASKALDKAKADRAKAAETLRAHVKTIIATTARRRLEAVKQYETALTIIGDVSK